MGGEIENKELVRTRRLHHASDRQIHVCSGECDKHIDI